MVKVVVGEHQECHPLHAQETKTSVEGCRVRPRVNEQDALVAAQQNRISLTDVAQGDAPVVGDGRRAQQRSCYRGATGRRQRAGEADRGDPPESSESGRPADQYQCEERQCGQCHSATEARPPGQTWRGPGRDGPGNRGDPPGGYSGEPDRDVCTARPPGREQAADEPEPGHSGRRRLRKQVCQHAVDRHGRVYQHKDGLTGELCGRRNSQHECERAWEQPAERRRDGFCQEEQARRCQDGEDEAQPTGNRRVSDDEHDDRREQRRHRRSRPPPKPSKKHHRGHHRRAHDARLRCDQQHEGRERRQRCGGAEATPGSEERRDRPARHNH